MSMKNTPIDDLRVTPYEVVRFPESTSDQVSIYCPYCGETHRHGWLHSETEPGHWVATCRQGGYHITAPTSWKVN